MNPLYVQETAGVYRVAGDAEVLTHLTRLLYDRLHDAPILSDPETVGAFLRAKLGTQDHESFAILYLDSRHRLIDYQEIFRGTVRATYVQPREIAREALKRNAVRVVLAHNHPAGGTEPSTEDKRLTEELVKVLKLIDITVLDHLIVGRQFVTSFAERGLL